MTKFDLGTLISAMSAFVVALLVYLRDAGGKLLGAIRVSFVAFVASPAVWLAAFLAGGFCFWGGWWMGHSAGAHGRSDLAAQVSLLKAAATKQELVRADLVRQVEEASHIIVTLRQAQVAPAEPRTPVVRRPAPRAPKVETTATAPAVTSWWPFER